MLEGEIMAKFHVLVLLAGIATFFWSGESEAQLCWGPCTSEYYWAQEEGIYFNCESVGATETLPWWVCVRNEAAYAYLEFSYDTDYVMGAMLEWCQSQIPGCTMYDLTGLMYVNYTEEWVQTAWYLIGGVTHFANLYSHASYIVNNW